MLAGGTKVSFWVVECDQMSLECILADHFCSYSKVYFRLISAGWDDVDLLVSSLLSFVSRLVVAIRGGWEATQQGAWTTLHLEPCLELESEVG